VTFFQQPPLFTNQQVAVIGLSEPNGLPLDPGAQEIFGDASLRGAFKVPSLRNIDRTAPYTHSGRFATLREMVQFYTMGRGHEIPPGEKLHIHWHIWEPDLREHELDRLVDFLKTLTDESFKPVVPEILPSGNKAPGVKDPVAPRTTSLAEKGKMTYYGVCSGCHAYGSRLIGPPVNVIQAMYKNNPKGIADYIANPVRKREDFPEMPPQDYLTDETRSAVAAYMLSLTT
jgi:mono/diheme cytochrome c family protein